MKSIQRFLGSTDDTAFHEPVFIVYARELSAFEAELEETHRKLKVTRKLLGYAVTEDGKYDVEASGGPPDPTQPPGTRDHAISKSLKEMRDAWDENSNSG